MSPAYLQYTDTVPGRGFVESACNNNIKVYYKTRTIVLHDHGNS